MYLFSCHRLEVGIKDKLHWLPRVCSCTCIYSCKQLKFWAFATCGTIKACNTKRTAALQRKNLIQQVMTAIKKCMQAGNGAWYKLNEAVYYSTIFQIVLDRMLSNFDSSLTYCLIWCAYFFIFLFKNRMLTDIHRIWSFLYQLLRNPGILDVSLQHYWHDKVCANAETQRWRILDGLRLNWLFTASNVHLNTC